MHNTEEDLKEDFINEIGQERWPDIEYILEFFTDNEFQDFEHNGLSITHETEKIHALQENVCVTISCDDFELELLYENGISNGTQLNEYRINCEQSFTQDKRYQEVLKGVKPDYEKMKHANFGMSQAKIRSLFKTVENEVLSLIKCQWYDNYVTGGGNNQADRHYQDKIRDLHRRGIYWIEETETIKVDSN